MSAKKNQPDDHDKIWGNPVAEESHTLTYEVKDAERVFMTDDKAAKAGGTSTPEIVAESIEPIPTAVPAQSQAVLDIKEAGLTPEEAAAASKALAEESDNKKGKKSKRPENLAVIAGFRWMVLLVLSVASVAVWVVDSQFISHRPYTLEAWALLAVCVVLSLLSFKVFRLPTRSGLAALCWSGTYFIDALYGPNRHILGDIPAAFPWAGLLTLVFIWVLVAIWRKLGRFKVIDVVLSIVLLYAACGILWEPIKAISSSAALNMTFQALSTSPSQLTGGSLPWFLWPMTVMIFFILPLAVIFALWDQFSALRRKGGRHGGNFFLALAFVGLLPYGFLVYDQAVKECPQLETAFRSIPMILKGGDTAAPTDPTTPAPVVTMATTTTPSQAETMMPPVTPEPAISLAEPPALPPVVEKTAEPTRTAAAPGTSADDAALAPAQVAATDPAVIVPQTQAVDPALVSALEDRLKETETRLQETENSLKDATARLVKAETSLEAVTSGLIEALKKVEALEKQVQVPPASSSADLDEVIDQRIQSLPGTAKTAVEEATTAPTPTPAASSEE